MNNVKIEKNDNRILQITKGLTIAFLITLATMLMFSIILTYSNISENIIPIAIIILTFISIFIGAIISTKNVNKNGMVNGGIIGGIYVILLYLISSILNTGFILNNYSIIMIISGIIAGLIGGIIGINS